MDKKTMYAGKKLVEVSTQVKKEYIKSVNREKYLNRLGYKYTTSLDELDSSVKIGIDIAELALNNILIEVMYNAIDKLKEDEKMLINKLYFSEKSEREYGLEIDTPQKTINDKKKKILSKLKKLIDNLFINQFLKN